MNRFRSVATAVALLVAACASGPPRREAAAPARPAMAAPERPLPYPVDLPPAYRAAIEAGTRTPTGEPGPRYWQQWTDYAIRVRLEPAAKRLTGSETIVYHNHSPDTLGVLWLNVLQNYHAEGARRLSPAEVTGGMTLERIAVDGTELPADAEEGPRYAVDGTLLRIDPPAPVPPGADVTIAADFHFTIPQRGIGARMGWSDDDLVYLGYFYPVMAVYDDVEGWLTDQFLGNAEFYAGFGRYDVTVEAPADWLVTGTGVLRNPGETLAAPVRDRLATAARSDSVVHVVTPAEYGRGATAKGAGPTLTWRFVADSVHDVAYAATRASNWDVTRTPVGDRDGDGRTDYARIDALWRESAPLWKNAASYAAEAIAHHSRFTATPYPWPHMTAVEGGGIIGGGMEFPMMTLIGDYNTRGDTALFNVVAHELAHEWVPMIASNDERRYAWMDEGTTTFNENMARMDHFPGTDQTAEDRATYLALARAEGEGPIMRWSDYHYPGPSYTIASYQKPATVLWALHAMLGDSTFMAAYHAFFDRWELKHPYPWDLFHTFDDVSGRDLSWFWRSWYYETWTLDQAVGRVTPGDGSTTIEIDDRGRVPMPVPLTVTCADGRTIDRTLPVDPWLAGRREQTATVGCRATRVEIDAAHAYPDADRSNDVWPREAGS